MQYSVLILIAANFEESMGKIFFAAFSKKKSSVDNQIKCILEHHSIILQYLKDKKAPIFKYITLDNHLAYF